MSSLRCWATLQLSRQVLSRPCMSKVISNPINGPCCAWGQRCVLSSVAPLLWLLCLWMTLTNLSLWSCTLSLEVLRCARFILQAEIRVEVVDILVDFGAQLNFIHTCLVQQLELRVDNTRHFQVVVGNGNMMICQGVCSIVPLSLDSIAVRVDLYVISFTVLMSCSGLTEGFRGRCVQLQ